MKSFNNPGFLEKKAVEGNDSSSSKVKLLLENPDPVNAMIGMNILNKGGVPKQLYNTLLIVSKCYADAKIRAKARKLLMVHGPDSWKPLLKDKHLFKNINTRIEEYYLDIKLKKLEKNIGFESTALLSSQLYKHYKKGLRFLLVSDSISEEWKKKVFNLLVTDGHFNFSSGLGFANLKDLPPLENNFYSYGLYFEMPTEILKYHKIESINLHNANLSSLPKDLFEFKDLKKIDLSFNSLGSIDPNFIALDKLEYLDLSHNIFSTFPVNITKLANLKYLDLRNVRRSHYDYTPYASLSLIHI